MRKLKVWGTLLALILAFTAFAVFAKSPVRAATIVDSGSCGANATWTLDSDGVLTVSGSGPMYDFSYSNTPWGSTYENGWYYESSAMKQRITRVVIGDGITYVGKNAFNACYNVASISISNTVTEIGMQAFWQTTALTSITIPDSVKTIGYQAFANDFNVTSLTLGSGLESIGEAAFYSCSGIPSVVIPAKMKSIESTTFCECIGLTSVTLPSTIESIGDRAFNGCSSLTSIDLPNTITSIGESAFARSGLTSIVIPSQITVIPASLCEECEHLSSVTIHNQVTTIGTYAFSSCESLRSIALPASVTVIEEHAFSGSGLYSFIVPPYVTEVANGTFAYCKDLSSITFQQDQNLTEIGPYAFSDCTSLWEIKIPEGVTTIREFAFQRCFALDSIIIPSTVTYIEAGAFSYMDDYYGEHKNPEHIYCYANPDNLTWDGYGNEFIRYGYNYKRTICHVPSIYAAGYQDSKFSNVNVTFAADIYDMGIGEHLVGYSLSLQGDIGVNFYMYFDYVKGLSDNAKMVFTITSLDGSSRTQEVYINSLPDPDATMAMMTNTLGRPHYEFTCHVSAKEMTSKITAQIVDGENRSQAYEYSVMRYAERILRDPDRYVAEQKLVKRLLNYGTAAQKYFNYNTSVYANAILDDSDKEIPAYGSWDLGQIQYTGDPKVNDDIRMAKANLVLESEITLNIYFTGATDSTVFKYAGAKLPTRKSGNYTIVSIKNIKAGSAKNDYEIAVYASEDDSTPLGTVSYSPMNYCYNVETRDITETRTQELKDLCRALHQFDAAASDYKDYLLHYS